MKDIKVRKDPTQEERLSEDQVLNSAGGFVYEIDHWNKFTRFLVLGTEGGTYYINEAKLNIENAENAIKCIKEDGKRAVDLIVDISLYGRSAKVEMTLFALAMAMSESFANKETRAYAKKYINDVVRTGTHLFMFVEFMKSLRGGGRIFREALSDWYNKKFPKNLEYLITKYQSRGKWTHYDVLNIAHPKPASKEHGQIYRYITKSIIPDKSDTIQAFEDAKRAQTEEDIIRLISDYKLVREHIPTKWLKSPAVWDALLKDMPLMAMLRNLGKLSNVGLVKPLSNAENLVTSALTDSARLGKSRIHPLQVLNAAITYGSGRGLKGKLTWDPSQKIIDALDDMFYMSFGNVEPTGKKIVLTLDVSGSMARHNISGMAINAREASAAMAMVTRRVERDSVIIGFTGGTIELDISPKDRLETVVKKISRLPFDRTDCAQPMIWAKKRQVNNADAFIVYTDNETYYGNVHPIQALKRYRIYSGLQSKLIAVGMTSTGFSIADPNDKGCLDIVGFDTASPQLISDFISGVI